MTWYEAADARGNYAARVFAAAAPVLAGCKSALDVGAGFGALALPLAARLDHVTAVEPSPSMRRALRRRLRTHGIDNVRVVPAAWGVRPVRPHDVVLCAHVGPLLGRGSAFIATVTRYARRAVVLVRDAPGGDDKFFFSELYPALLGREYRQRSADAETVRALTDHGITPSVRIVRYRSDQPFRTLDEACEFWMTYLGRRDAAARRFLRTFLRQRLQRDGRGWLAPYTKRAAVITWRV